MTTQWLVAKYIRDMRRREPENIGVILVTSGGESRGRFRAVRDDGSIDGRSARFAASADNYRAHLRYWCHLIDQGFTDDAVARAIQPLGDESYFLEFGGQRLSAGAETTDPAVLLDQLYATLVDETPASANLSVSNLAETVIRELPLSSSALRRGFRLETPPGHARDVVEFDYRFDNGAVHLMRNVPLSFADQRSWDAVHATLYSFNRAEQLRVERGVPQRYISFVKPRDADTELAQQLNVLGSRTSLVDVSNTDDATSKLAGLLGLQSN